jgi:hypothetical protein
MNPSQQKRLAAPGAAPRFRGSASPILMIAGLLAVLPPLAASGADVQVQLQDPAGLAVPDTRVTARHRTSGQEIACTTAPEGVCRLDLPLAGAYQITAARNGLEAQIEFLAGSSRTLTLVLEPALMRTAITVVSGSRVEELQEESPVKVDAVSRQEMLSTGYERVSDVLQEIPGNWGQRPRFLNSFVKIGCHLRLSRCHFKVYHSFQRFCRRLRLLRLRGPA